MASTTGRFILADGADTVIARQLTGGSETRAALDQWAKNANLGSGDGGGGGTATLPTGVLQTIEVNPDGTWPTFTRADGVRILWLRAITPTENAPIPTETDGYQPGDLISPAANPNAGEFLQSTGMVFSDSFATTATEIVSVAGRTSDQFAGGFVPVTWDYAVAPGGGTFPSVNVYPDDYLHFSDFGFTWPRNPIPLSADRSIEFDIYRKAQQPRLIIGLHGDNLASNLTCVTVMTDDNGVSTWAIEGKFRSTTTRVTMGTLTAAPWAHAIVTQRGSSITVTHDGRIFTGTLPTAATQLPLLAGFGADAYGQVDIRNLTYTNL